MERKSSIVANSVDPAGKASFVQGFMYMSLMGQHNGKGLICLVYASKPLMTVITALVHPVFNMKVTNKRFSHGCELHS